MDGVHKESLGTTGTHASGAVHPTNIRMPGLSGISSSMTGIPAGSNDPLSEQHMQMSPAGSTMHPPGMVTATGFVYGPSSVGNQHVHVQQMAQFQQQQQQLQQHLAAVHLQHNAQMHPQMMHFTGQQMQDVGLHIQDPAALQFFPGFLTGSVQSVQLARTDDLHRQGGVSYPINTIFVNNDEKNCCLLDRGSRCLRPAGTAGFTHRIRDLVSRSGAQLMEDGTAGHQYICDFHKNYIQKIPRVVPGGPVFLPMASPSPSIYSQFAAFSPMYSTVDSLTMHPTNVHGAIPVSVKPEESTHNDRPPSVKQKSHLAAADVKGKDNGDLTSSSGPVDMRRTQGIETRAVTASASPEANSSDSSDEEYEGGPVASDLLYGLGDVFTHDDLLNYVKHFEIDVPTHPTKEELTRVVCEHMDTVPTTDAKTSLVHLFHAVKTDSRAFNQPYKPPLSVDFDPSTDEELVLMDGKNGVVNEDTSSWDSDISSDSDTDEGGEAAAEELPTIQYDREVERALSQMNGISVDAIERILEKYSLPSKRNVMANRDSDTNSSSSDEKKHRAKRNNVHPRKRRQLYRNGNN